jgi:LPXTG-site transpeptidase (sortase) family protein
MNGSFEQLWRKKFVFFFTFFVVFTLTYLVLVALDWLPEPPMESDDQTESPGLELEVVPADEVSELSPKVAGETEQDTIEAADTEDSELAAANTAVLPTEITISRLDKTVAVLNPVSRSIADLDAALLDGVVRHPDSATLGQDGNVFILGHSSYLPNVFNKNFQAFNGIQNLEWGDSIEVKSADQVYEYRVEKVYRARAQDVTVPIAGDKKMLTIATCNSFGSVDDRFIVEAKQTNVRSL